MEKDKIDLTEELLKVFIEKRRPQDLAVRKELDMGYSWDGSIALLYTIRPQWDNPERILHHEFAKIRYYKSRNEWHLFWMRASGKWEPYEPCPVASHLQRLLTVIDEDAHHCFFG